MSQFADDDLEGTNDLLNTPSTKESSRIRNEIYPDPVADYLLYIYRQSKLE